MTGDKSQYLIERRTQSEAEVARLQADGAGMIAAERLRQIQGEGYTPAHDDQHTSGQMLLAAVAYALPHAGYYEPACEQYWPWRCGRQAVGYNLKDTVHDLVRAGALIAAEIDRLLRTAEMGGGADNDD